MVDVASVPFEQLVKEYESLLHRYANWQIPHYDHDDLMQELRLVLWKTQRRFDPALMQPNQKQPASFRTYLLRAVRSRMGRLQHMMSWTQSRGAVPWKDSKGNPVYNDKGDRMLSYRPAVTIDDDENEVDAIDTKTSMAEIEVLASLDRFARPLVESLFEGASLEDLGFSKDEIELARQEIRLAVGTSI